MGLKAVALIWGLLEATFFFIVPDVWTTIVARQKLHPGITATVMSLVGALIGGAFMYYLGSAAPDTVTRIMGKIPGININLINHVAVQLQDNGPVAIFLGPPTGTPYKLYAYQAAKANIGFWTFLAISIPARLIRFLAVTLFAHYGLKGISALWPPVNGLALLLSCWILFYLTYFYAMAS